jgi:hypothetical protein
MKQRKIIQIATIPGDKDWLPRILALCDDGSLWQATFDYDNDCIVSAQWNREYGPPGCVREATKKAEI